MSSNTPVLDDALTTLADQSWVSTSSSDARTVVDYLTTGTPSTTHIAPGYNDFTVSQYTDFLIELDESSSPRVRVTKLPSPTAPTTRVPSSGQSVVTIPNAIVDTLDLSGETTLNVSLQPGLNSFTLRFSLDSPGVFTRELYETYQAQHDYYQYKVCLPGQLVHALQLASETVEWSSITPHSFSCQPIRRYPIQSLLPPENAFEQGVPARITHGTSATTSEETYSEYQLYVPASICREASLESRDTVAVYLFAHHDKWMIVLEPGVSDAGSQNHRRVFGDETYDGVHFKFPKQIGNLLTAGEDISAGLSVRWLSDKHGVLYGVLDPFEK